MKRSILFLSMAIMALLSSCKKLEIEPVDGDPVFSTEAKFNENAQLWIAGVDDYYMFSSFEKDKYNIHVFKSIFAQKDNCCTESLAFHLRDFQQMEQGSPEILVTLDKKFQFADNSGNDTTTIVSSYTIWQAGFTTTSFSQPSLPLIYEWIFGDQTETTTAENTIQHNYQTIPDNLPVTLNVKTANEDCSGFFTRNINGDSISNNNCQLNFNAINIYNDSIAISVTATGLAPFVFQWNNGTTGNTYNQTINPIMPIEVSVTVTDAGGCAVSAGLTTSAVPGAIPPVCVAAFDYTVQAIVVDTQYLNIQYADSLQYSNITIVYTDKDGHEYRSDRKKQAPSAFIDLLKIEDYENNERGNKTKKVSIEYACMLWDEQGNVIEINDGKGVIAIAYP